MNIPPVSATGPNPADADWMRQALGLAERAIGVTEPNPRVGCVIVDPSGQILGQGHTQAAGQAHAEVMALRAAVAAGRSVRGATAYVTLEPCAHQGRTGPCCDALISAGIGRVVAALEDPNPRVAGQGLARLRAAGVVVEVGPLAAEATAMNIGFLHRMRTGRPWVRLKWAASLDARTALPDGRSQWITGPAARRDGQQWRRRAGAVLTGIGTALADDPRLDVREPPVPELQPLRVVLDRHLRLSPKARLLQPPGSALVVHCAGAPESQARALRAAGASLWCTPVGGASLGALLDELGRREVNELHIEAGATLNGQWLKNGLVDELLIYLAPRLLGPGLGVADVPLLDDVQSAAAWRWLDVSPVGDDLRLRLQRP